MVSVTQKAPAPLQAYLSPAPALPALKQLGLAEGPIVVRPIFKTQDMYTDDFGPDVPAEVLMMIAEVNIDMTLIHFDDDVLETCVAEAMGGGAPGVIAGAGTPMGAMLPVGVKGNHYISLNISSTVLGRVWRFPASYLMTNVELPLGTGRTAAKLTWRAIPYVAPQRSFSGNQLTNLNNVGPQEFLISKGVVLWDHQSDT